MKLLHFSAFFAIWGVAPVLSQDNPPLNPQALEDLVNRDNLLKHAEQFLAFSELSNGTRAFGSKGHDATIRYIKRLLDETGFYDTEFEEFVYSYSEATAQFSVNGHSYPTRGLGYAPSGEVTGPVPDFPGTVKGNIALILRGTCDLGLKVALAGGAGAIGSIIYNNIDAEPISGTLGAPSRPQGPYVPSAYISGLNGKAFIASIEAGTEVIANIRVQSIVEDRITANVIATTKEGDRENVIVAGAHSDSVPAGPGLNDDGSGSMGILEVALSLAKFNGVKNAVRFIWWSAEEFGLIGSEYHVEHLSDEARQKVALYLNFDMIASPNAGYFVFDGDGDETGVPGPPGSEAIESLYRAYFDRHNITTGSAVFGGSSDYQPFVDVGIPSGGLMTGASGIKTAEGAQLWGGEAGIAYDICYHQRCDVIENLNVDAWERNSKAVAHSIATYAQSVEGIPRPLRGPVRSLRVSNLSYEERLHLTCDHDDDIIYQKPVSSPFEPSGSQTYYHLTLSSFDSMAQVIVVGGGLAGLSAAHTLLERGANVLLLDKQPFMGGNSTKATSGINGAGTNSQRKLGIPDTAEIFFADTKKSARDLARDDLIHVLTGRSGDAVNWLQDKFALDLSLVSRLGGHSQPRTHRGGAQFPGMVITYAQMERLEDLAVSSPERVKIIKKARVSKLVKDESGAVVGVEYVHNGQTSTAYGPVVLATGGYAADFTEDSLLKKHRPEFWNLPTTNGEHCTGDGHKLAMAAGANAVDLEKVQVHPTGLVDPNEPDAKVKFLAAEALRGVGGLLLDNTGKRFVDELQHRDYVTGKIWENGKFPIRLVLNGSASKEIEWHCKHYVGRGLMKRFDSGEALAKEFGLAPEVLKKTFEDYNQASGNLMTSSTLLS
ncbi:hypothetical protein NMY22_g128 [Coprinellus aureogranulatus]|nr:hypothetical protein NMY22_g128 [Coprinellus aureogranulatus]